MTPADLERIRAALAERGRLTFICERCGTQFRELRGNRRHKHVFCSHECSRRKIPPVERFWPRVNKNGPVIRPELGQCWEFKGAEYGGWGHKQFYDGTRNTGAHRVSWVFAHGPIPDGLLVCHKCDNPPCVNPAHLFLGTVGDNTRDARDKGRLKGNQWARGETHPHAKLTEASVRSIRESSKTAEELAREFGVAPHSIRRIVRRAAWRHVP